MRVLQVIDSLSWGGTQEVLVTLAGAAQNSAVSISVAGLREDESSPYRARLEKSGARVWSFPGRGLLDGKRILALSHFMQHEGFDIIHTHLTYANIAGAFAARRVDLPLVTTLHVPDEDRNFLRKHLNHWVLRYFTRRITAVASSVAQTYSSFLRKGTIQVLPNAVHLPAMLPEEERGKVRRELMGRSEGLLLISCGRLERSKGYEDLLQAAVQLRTKHISFTLLIAGSGKLHDSLREQIRNHALSKHVHLLGGRSDVPRLLAASDVYVSASHVEGMSVSILEAMAAALPVVAACAGDNPRLVLPETGILVPIGDPGALAAGIATLAESRQLRAAMGAEGRSLVGRRHNVESWFKQIQSLYEQVLQETTCTRLT